MPSKISLNKTHVKRKIKSNRMQPQFEPIKISHKNSIMFQPVQPRKQTKRRNEPDEESFCECFKKEREQEIYISPSKVISREQLMREPRWRFCQSFNTQY